MANMQNFRSAFRGFNREDVVRYIEYLNNQHTAQIAQLNSQLQAAQENASDVDLHAQLDAALHRCEELEEKLKNVGSAPPTDSELEAYRRAERAERMANDRAQQIYAHANSVLAEATKKAQEASVKIAGAADSIASQLAQFQSAVTDSKETMREAVDTLYAIQSEE